MQMRLPKAAILAMLVIACLKPSTMAQQPTKDEDAAKTKSEDAAKVETSAKLDRAYEQVWQQINNTYGNPLPKDWTKARTRFHQKLKTSGHVRGSIALSLTTIGDRRLCVLDPEQVEDYLCRQGSGFVGLGIMFSMVQPKDGKGKPYFIVESVTENSPAASAGIKPGDKVRKVLDIDLTDRDLDDVIQYAKYGNLGTEIPIQLERDGKQIDVNLKRSIVELPQKSAVIQSLNDGQGGTAHFVTLKNLDWRNLPSWIDKNVATLHRSPQVTIDLRGTRGDDVEITARVAARFVENGEVLRYSERKGYGHSLVIYRVEKRDGLAELLSSRDCGEWQSVEKGFPQNISSRLMAIVDDQTSGTAEALVHALHEARRAEVWGTSAGVNMLVVNSIIEAAETSLYVQVPARILLTSKNTPLTTINVASVTTPAGSEPKAETVLRFLFLLGSIGCFLSAFCIVLFRRTGKPKMGLLTIALVVLGAIGLFRYNLLLKQFVNQKPPQATPAQTDAQKAAARIINLLRTDKEVRTDYGVYKNVTRRGNLDAPEPKETGAFPMVPEPEIDTACRIATALTEGDATEIRKIMASYVHKPYARAQIAFCLESALRKLDARYHLMAIDEWLLFEQMGAQDGGFVIQFSALDDFSNEDHVPFVSHFLKTGDRSHSATQPKDISNEEVMKAFSLDIVQSVLTADPNK